LQKEQEIINLKEEFTKATKQVAETTNKLNEVQQKLQIASNDTINEELQVNSKKISSASARTRSMSMAEKAEHKTGQQSERLHKSRSSISEDKSPTNHKTPEPKTIKASTLPVKVSQPLISTTVSTQETPTVTTKPLISKIGSISNLTSSTKLVPSIGTTKAATGTSRIGSVSNKISKQPLNSIQIEDESNKDEQTPDMTTDS